MKNYGSIYHRKDGYYYGRVSYNGMKKAFYSRNEKEVQEQMNNWIMECKYNNVTLNNSILLSEYIGNYLYTYKYGFLKQQSFDRLESLLKCHIKGSAVDVPMYKLDDILVQQYLNDKAKNGLSRSSLKKIYDLLRAVLSYSYRKKDINLDVASLLQCPRSIKECKTITVYSDNDVSMLYQGIYEVLKNPTSREERLFRYSPAYVFMLNTGLRAGEMLALSWSDIDFKSCIIHVRHSLEHVINREDGNKYVNVIGGLKTEASKRDIPLNRMALECLHYLKSISDCEYVVSNGKGNFLLLRSFQQTFQRICNYLGLPYNGLHALRHTFASRLIASGISPKVVSDLLGHTSVVFTLNRYVHSEKESLNDAVRSLVKEADEKQELSGKVSGKVSGKEKQCLQSLANTAFLENSQ